MDRRSFLKGVAASAAAAVVPAPVLALAPPAPAVATSEVIAATGASLTASETWEMYNAMLYYMEAIGAGPGRWKPLPAPPTQKGPGAA